MVRRGAVVHGGKLVDLTRAVSADDDALHAAHRVVVVPTAQDRAVRKNALWNRIGVPRIVHRHELSLLRQQVTMDAHGRLSREPVISDDLTAGPYAARLSACRARKIDCGEGAVSEDVPVRALGAVDVVHVTADDVAAWIDACR